MASLEQWLKYILAQKDPQLANETKRIVLKEALQAYVLDFLYNHPTYRRMNFYGGTCLHVVFNLNRLSEDIDLDNSTGVNLDTFAADLSGFFRKTLGYTALQLKTQVGEAGILHLTLKYPVLNALGLSVHPDEALHLKVEISHHPQVAVIRKTPVLMHGRSFVAAHFSLETMMAGKMLACLERNFQRGRTTSNTKGRDWFDLLWFMQQKIQPLAEKLAQDGSQPYTAHSAFQILQDRVNRIRMDDLARDLLPMFEQREYIAAWLEGFKENFAMLVIRYLESSGLSG